MMRDEFLVALVADITDRRGLKHEWNSIDDDVKAEILATWGGLTDRLLAAARAEALRLAMDECEAEAALCDSEKSGLDAGSAARNCRDRIEFALVKP